MANDYYATLGVARDATGEEIKRSYRKLARELHPDVNPDPETQERFKEVTAAYEVLSDPEKRQMYDLGADPGEKRNLARPGEALPPEMAAWEEDVFDALARQQRKDPVLADEDVERLKALGYLVE